MMDDSEASLIRISLKRYMKLCEKQRWVSIDTKNIDRIHRECNDEDEANRRAKRVEK